MEYQGLKGGRYDFSGWMPNEKPSACFDRGDYLACLHGVTLALYLCGQPDECIRSLSDDGIVHELVHLAGSVEISTHNSLDVIRAEVVELENRAVEWTKQA